MRRSVWVYCRFCATRPGTRKQSRSSNAEQTRGPVRFARAPRLFSPPPQALPDLQRGVLITRLLNLDIHIIQTLEDIGQLYSTQSRFSQGIMKLPDNRVTYSSRESSRRRASLRLSSSERKPRILADAILASVRFSARTPTRSQARPITVALRRSRSQGSADAFYDAEEIYAHHQS